MDNNDIELPEEGDRHRKSLDLLPETWEELATMSKKHKITQGEVIDMMAHLLKGSLLAADLYDRRRAAKVAARQPKKEMNSLLRSLTPEQLAAALEAARKAQP
jgi:macrodomain Ter protein organizer (MatP/YcbG family)